MIPRFLHPVIFLISFVGIAYQVILMRIFAIAQWHHFAYMMISIAMLGFAAGGTILTLVRQRLRGREHPFLCFIVFFLTGSLTVCYAISQKIPFETYQLVSQPKQIAYLLCLYLLLSVPFFFVSCAILLAFFLDPTRIGRVYGFNMIGSGFGALGVVGLMYWVQPDDMVYLLTIPAVAAFVLLTTESRRLFAKGLFGLAVLGFLLIFVGKIPIRVSEYKGLSYALRMPDAKIVAQSQSPLSVITAVQSSRIREAPGQISYDYAWKEFGTLPEQAGLFFDADSISVINRFDGSLDPFAYLDFVTSALPYHLIKPERVLVIGAGGGTDVLMAFVHRAKKITAVEIDPHVFKIIRDHFRNFSGRIYERPEVTPVIAEGREFLQSRQELYDLIHIPPLDSFSASAAGVYALNESYLYTTEAVTLYLRHLTPSGMLAITRWLKTPPRDELKIFATMVEAAEAFGIKDPADHLAFIRSWNTGTLVISRSPLTGEQIQAIRDFIQKRGFDAGYYPGVRPEETNRFTVLEEPIYDQALKALLSKERETFYKNYLFDIRPARDDRPYFFQFFKWSAFPKLLKGMGTEWIPFVEWGYLTLIATIFQAGVASLILIFLPLIFGITGKITSSPLPSPPEEGREKRRGVKLRIFLYFSAIGFAYMFLEIAFMQKFMLFLAYPIYAVAVVLTSFLIFSGMGSYLADWYRARILLVLGAVATIFLVTVVYLTVLPAAFSYWASWKHGMKILASIILLAPLAFCMGIPFPCGMQVVSETVEPYMSWAWAINGCASVLGAMLATLIAIHFGFQTVVSLSVLMYAGAVIALYRLALK